MRKFRCPKCKTEFLGTLENCPKCGTRLHYRNEEVKREEVKAAPKQTFFYDDDRVNKNGIIDDETLEKERSGLKIRELEPKYQNKEKFGLEGESYFDGLHVQKIGLWISGAIITICTLFLGFPIAMCNMYRWEYQHTVICGHRLDFNGTGKQLFGRYVLWLFLTIITLGIFSYWMATYLKKWKMKHVLFMEDNEERKGA